MPSRSTDATDRAWTDVLVTVDVATSAARASAFDLDGNRRLETRRPYPSFGEEPGWSEQDPRAWRSAALGALAELVQIGRAHV